MIPLAMAILCIDCEGIYHGSAGGQCPHCQSHAVMPIARWMNREELPTEIVVTPTAILALAEAHGLDVTPDSWL